MSSVQVKFHLIKEIIESLYLPDNGLSELGSILLACKQTFVAVQELIFKRVIIGCPSRQARVYIAWNDESSSEIEPVYLQKLALRWARHLEFTPFRQDFCPTEIKEYVMSLRENNNLETLELSAFTQIEPIFILPMCPNLTTLQCCTQDFGTLLETTTIDVSNLRVFRGLVNVLAEYYSSFFTYITKHPERCPELAETTLYGAFEENIFSKTDYSIPSVKSLKLKTNIKCCTCVDFESLAASIVKQFPNIANVKLSVSTDCDHEHINLAAYEQLYESFKNFNFPFAFNFKYKPDNNYDYHHTELEALLYANGTVEVDVNKEEHWSHYIVTTTYPNKVMKLKNLEMDEIDDDSLFWSDNEPMDVDSDGEPLQYDEDDDLMNNDEDGESVSDEEDDDLMEDSDDGESAQDDEDDDSMDNDEDDNSIEDSEDEDCVPDEEDSMDDDEDL